MTTSHWIYSFTCFLHSHPFGWNYIFLNQYQVLNKLDVSSECFRDIEMFQWDHKSNFVFLNIFHVETLQNTVQSMGNGGLEVGWCGNETLLKPLQLHHNAKVFSCRSYATKKSISFTFFQFRWSGGAPLVRMEHSPPSWIPHDTPYTYGQKSLRKHQGQLTVGGRKILKSVLAMDMNLRVSCNQLTTHAYMVIKCRLPGNFVISWISEPCTMRSVATQLFIEVQWTKYRLHFTELIHAAISIPYCNTYTIHQETLASVNTTAPKSQTQ